MTTVRGLVMAAVLIATSAWPGVAVAQETPSRVDALSARLASENERTRESAAEALGRLGARALVAAPLLLARTADEDEYVAAAAIIALARVTRDQDSAALAQTLRRLASDTAKPTAVRAAAMTALGYCVPDAATVDTLLAGHAEGRDAWKVSSRAGAALVRLGRAAVPAIAAQLDSRDEAAISRALALLAAIGPAAEEAVPAMIRHFGNDDGDLRTAAWKAVARVGAAAVPSLIDAAGRGSENHRVAAMRAIEQLGDLAREAAPALMAALNQSSLWIVAAAARALVATGGITPAAAPRLTALLGETNDSICAVCARALGAIGPAAREAIPALVAGLERRLRDTFNAIADAIRRIDLAAAIAPLLAALDHAEPLVRSRAATLLGGLDDNNRSRAIPRLIRALDDVSQPTPLAAAAAALAALGATDAVPRLRELASHTDAYIRNIATCALAKLRDTTVVPLLIEQVSNGGLYHIYREAACRALGDVPDQSAVPALLAAMRDPQIELQEAAIATLGAFGAVAADAVPRLTGILANPRGPMGRHLDEAAAALVSIGAPAVDAVAALLESGDTGVRYLAARFLARFGPAARPALDRLRKALADHDREVVSAVVCATAALGTDMIDEVERLAAPEQSAARRAGAVEAMATFDETPDLAARAFGTIAAGLSDDDANVRDAAFRSMELADVTIVQRESAGQAVRALLAMLRATRESGTQRRIMFQLARFGAAAHEAVGLLWCLLQDGDDEVADRAACTLLQVGAALPAALTRVIRMLDHADRRLPACAALGGLGRAAAPALARLRAIAAGDPDADVRRVASDTIGRIR